MIDPTNPLMQKLPAGDQATFLALQDYYSNLPDDHPDWTATGGTYDQYVNYLDLLSGATLNNNPEAAAAQEAETLGANAVLSGAQGTAPPAGGTGTGPATEGPVQRQGLVDAANAEHGLLAGVVDGPLPTARTTPSAGFSAAPPTALSNVGETAIAEGIKSAPMPGPESFAGAATQAAGMGQKLMGALTSKAGMGLLMTGLGAALYMTSRKKTPEEPRQVRSAGITPASPNISTINPYAAARAGSPQYGSILPGNFRIQ